MRTGKLQESVLKRSVLRQLDQGSMANGVRYGADTAVLPGEGEDLTVCAVDGNVPGFSDAPGAIVTSVANHLAAAGAVPTALTIHALLPVSYTEAQLREDMQQIAAAAAQNQMQVLTGHTQVSEEVTHSQYTINGIGQAKRKTYHGAALLQPGQELVLTKWIALAGTAALAVQYEEELKQRYPFTLIDKAKEFEKLMSVAEEARAITHFGACAVHDLSQSGVFGALWEMAERAGTGLEVELKKIPVKQETIEICEYFDINPYYLYSAGSLLIGTTQAEALIRALCAAGIPATVIGRVTDGNDRIIRNGEDVRFLDRPQQEEWYRRIEK